MSPIVKSHYGNFKLQIMMTIVLCLALIFIFTSIVQGTDVKSLCCNDWIPFKDEKCVKLFTSFETRYRAEEECNKHDSILVTINSAAEQKFLIEYVFNTSDSNNVWIGAERRLDSPTEFDWNDGTPVQRFTNWAIGHPSDDVRRICVYMKSPLSRNISEMEWVDEGCDNGYWFICEKLQAWPIERVQQVLLSTRRELQYSVDTFTTVIDEIRNNFTKLMIDMRSDFTNQLNDLTNLVTVTIDTVASQATQLNSNTNLLTDTRNTLTTQGAQVQALQANPVPSGFIYVQLWNQPEPGTIWPTVTWTEVTSQYAGLFFRAQGGNSASFGTIQAESSPSLSRVDRITNPSSTFTGVNVHPTGQASSPVQIGPVTTTSWGLTFIVSSAEVRPRNQAMRIWRRI